MLRRTAELAYPSRYAVARPAGRLRARPGKLMTKDEATALLVAALHDVAPEVDLVDLDPALPLQEVADIDSRDFLTLVADIRRRAGVDIPVRDYPKLATVELFVSYLMGPKGSL
jgi:acyl carrier protein